MKNKKKSREKNRTVLVFSLLLALLLGQLIHEESYRKKTVHKHFGSLPTRHFFPIQPAGVPKVNIE